ncbi:MAG: hypothetical protein KatS3mg087_1533 [Patescibacteria group bacterium]|nr:MAG: hypothetical protein KatS3mg087_1533 [Patescibacteria group bacterium]
MDMKIILKMVKPILIGYLRERGLVLPDKTIKELAKKLRVSESRIQVIAQEVKEAILEQLERL